MKITTPVNLIKKISLGILLSSVLYAAPSIPASCTTPGSCPDLTPALKNATVKEGVKFADADASHTATIKAAATTTENVVITLPATNGQPNQILTTDATGKLVWEDKPHNLVGMIGFMVPNNAKGIYEINGQTVTDAKLAAYITANPMVGFSVSGNNVTLPNWKGRFLGASNGYGMSATAGALQADATAVNGLRVAGNGSHKHNIHYTNGGAGPGYLPTANDAIGYQYSSQRNVSGREDMDTAGYHGHSLYGDSYTRPTSVSMPMVIIGGSK